MIWLSLRELRARPWRAALTGLAAVIGVSLISGTFVLLDTARGTDGDAEQLGTVILIAGAVSLLVGAFVITTALSVTAAQRTRELALLRCLGADGRQVGRLIRSEALIVGVAASVAGLLAGVAMTAAMRTLVLDKLPVGALVVAPRTVLASLAAGVVVMLISALIPARRAARVPPLAALQVERRRRGAALGLVLTAAGLGAVPVAALAGQGYLLIPAGALTLLGVRLAGHRLVVPLVHLVGAPFARLCRLPGALARHNAIHNPERTAATASALMIGLALVGLIMVLSASTKAAAEAEFAAIRADFRVHADFTTAQPYPLSPDLIDGLRARPDLPVVAVIQSSRGTAGGRAAVVSATDPVALAQVQDLPVSDLATGDIAITDDVARTHGWSVGSRAEVGLARGTRVFVVRAIYADRDYAPGPPDYLITPSDYAALGGEPAVFDLYARGPTPPIERSDAIVQDRAAMYQEAVGQIGNATTLYLALTGMAVLVGMFGIVTTMALSIVDRVRELGLLRAVGMQRKQIRTMIRVEAVIIALVGAILGLGLGVLFGWAAAKVLEDSSAPTRFAVPLPQLLLIAAVATAIGVLGAVLPARQASRTDVLRAVAAE